MAGRLARILGVTLGIGFLVANAAPAAVKATKEECLEKTAEAVRVIEARGEEAALPAFRDKAGPFVWKDTYVFVIGLDGVMRAHPITPKLEGKNLLGIKDVNGKYFVAEYLALAREKGEGWVEFMWPDAGGGQPKEKLTFVRRVPGTDVVVGAGIYK